MSSMQSAHIPWEVEPHEYRLTPILEVTPEQEQRLKRNLSFALSRGEEAEFLAYREQVAAEVFDILEGYRDHIDPAIYESLHADLVTELLPLDNQAVKRVQLIKRTLEKTLGMWTGEMTSVDRENAMQTAYSAIRTEKSAKERVRAVETIIGYAIEEYFVHSTEGDMEQARILGVQFAERNDVHVLVRDLKLTALKRPEAIEAATWTTLENLRVLLIAWTGMWPTDTEFLGEFTEDEVLVDDKLLAFRARPMKELDALCDAYNASVTACLAEHGYRDSAGKPIIFESGEMTLEDFYLTEQRFTSPEWYRLSIIETAAFHLCDTYGFRQEDLTWAHVATH